MSLAGLHRYIPRPDWTEEDYRRARREMLADIERTRRQSMLLYALSIGCSIVVFVAIAVRHFA